MKIKLSGERKVIDTDKGQSSPELEKAAEDFANLIFTTGNDYLEGRGDGRKEGFIAGAQWRKDGLLAAIEKIQHFVDNYCGEKGKLGVVAREIFHMALNANVIDESKPNQ